MRLPFVNWRPHWFIDYAGLRQEGSRRQGRKLTYQALELGGNDFLIVLVAGMGFFTDSYVLFASNVMLPMLGFIYWHNSINVHHAIAFNCATLAGSILGMAVFGFSGDRWGRRKMYGLELIILILGTIGVLMSSPGYVPLDQVKGATAFDLDYGTVGSMNVQSWLLLWRFVSGIGIGGDYPLSAVLVSEMAPTRKRSRMLATIFSMQAFGYAAATLVSLIVVTIVQSQHLHDSVNSGASARAVDQIWRWVTGLGLIPALLAVIMRLLIPESPRYTLDVVDDPFKALDETDRLRRSNHEAQLTHESNMEIIQRFAEGKENDEDGVSSDATHQAPNGESCQPPSWRKFFLTDGNWRTLFATTADWFLLDFALFGLGLNSPQTISKVWYNKPPPYIPEVWDTRWDDLNASIFSILIEDSVHSLLVSSIAALVGSILLIIVISHINRKLLTWVMFLVSGFVFVIIGSTFHRTVETQFSGVTITLYALCQFCLYFGPNPLTFMVPAELYPTKYRATCHGLSAAAGKLGSVIVQLFLGYVTFRGSNNRQSNPDSKWLGWVLLIFAIPMFLGAFISWLWLPDLQHKNGESKTLEVLAEGRKPQPRPESR